MIFQFIEDINDLLISARSVDFIIFALLTVFVIYNMMILHMKNI